MTLFFHLKGRINYMDYSEKSYPEKGEINGLL